MLFPADERSLPPDDHPDHLRLSRTGATKALDLLLWLAGPYERDAATGWRVAEPVPGPETLSGFCDTQGCVDVARLTERLGQLGIVAAVHPVCRCRRSPASARSRDAASCGRGRWPTRRCSSSSSGRGPGHPTAEEIAEAIGEGHNLRTTRRLFSDDSRFTRVDMDHIALASLEPSGIRQHCDGNRRRDRPSRRIGERRDLVATLVRQFSLRGSNACECTFKAPMFIIEGDTVRRRTDGEDKLGVPPSVTTAPACYLLGSETVRLASRADLRCAARQRTARRSAGSPRGVARCLPGRTAGLHVR